MALSRAPGEVRTEALLPLLSNPDPAVRGAAALALARHQPQVAVKAVPAQLQLEISAERTLFEERRKHERSPLSPEEIAAITGSFRCQMKMVQAISMLHDAAATSALEEKAFRPGKDFSQMNGHRSGI